MSQKTGSTVPLVFVPRFTTYCGINDFFSVALDVTGYCRIAFAFWSGPVLGVGTLTVQVQTSQDAEVWFDEGPEFSAFPSDTVGKFVLDLERPWVRIRVSLEGNPGDEAAVTCWATGALEKRLP